MERLERRGRVSGTAPALRGVAIGGTAPALRGVAIGGTAPALRGASFAALIAVAAVVSVAACNGGPDTALTNLLHARELASDLRVQFGKATGASDRAVMADTDEASIAFAQQAEHTATAIESEATTLAERLQELGYANESRLLHDFQVQFTKYRELDRSVLELAVENTNLKAQRLAFGPAQQAANALREALEKFASAAPNADRCRVDALVAKVMLAVREIQVLQAPHIAEADGDAMTRIETQMSDRQSSARDAMNTLAAPAALAEAAAALERFTAVSSEIVKLSRRNSNVRSLSLSLAQKPALVAACDSSLVALEDALAKEGFSATR